MTDVVANLPPQIAEGAERSIAFTQSPELAQLGDAGNQLVTGAQNAFVNGISGAMTAAAVVLVLAGIAVAFLAARPRTGGHRDL
jgi:hypothetical protein